MHAHTLLSLALSLPLAQAAETILGVYIFSRHGDRTSKSTPPTVLTDLGYREVFDSGTWFRENYIVSGASKQINDIETDVVKLSQLAVSAPLDNVLMPSAQGFMQGMYPPVGSTLGSITLRNGTVVQAPLDGFQIIPIQTITSGTGSESQAWLQGSSNCNNAEISSNDYFSTPEYMDLLSSTKAFYQNNILPSVNATFNSTETTFHNAYSRMLKTLFRSSIPLFFSNKPNSFRPYQCRRDPQRHHQLLQPPHKRYPLPTAHTSRHPRIQSRLQRQRPCARHNRRNTRLASPPSPKRHRHSTDRKPQTQHPIRRLRRFPILLWPRQPDHPHHPQRHRQLLRRPRLRQHHDLRALHQCDPDPFPCSLTTPGAVPLPQRHDGQHQRA